MKFTVKELVPAIGESGIVYDTSTYTAEVTLTDDGKGTISASVAWSVGSKSVDSAIFRNRFIEQPVTGDTNELALYALLAILSATGLCLTAAALPRRKEER